MVYNLIVLRKFHVGLTINANHVGSVRANYVIGKGTIVHKGRTTHIWNIEVKDEKGKMISMKVQGSDQEQETQWAQL